MLGSMTSRGTLGVLASINALVLAMPVPGDAQNVPVSPTIAEAAAKADPCGGGLLTTTDRPTFGTNPCVVKQSQAHVEAGYKNQTSSNPTGSSLVTFPNARLREGLAHNVEFLIDVPTTLTRSASAGPTPDNSFGDVGVGLKWEAGHGKRFVHGLAGEVVFPAATTAFGTGVPSFNGSYQAAYGILPRLGVGITLGFNDFATPLAQTTIARSATSFRNPTTLAFTPAFAVGGSIFPTTKISLEIAQNSSQAALRSGSTYGDVFVQQLVFPSVLVDANIGQRFNALPNGSRQHYAGAGIAVHL